MSDTPQSPDWWLASDGKWYPPTSRPATAAPPVGPGPYDTQPAPDWWLASDGKWYPPTSRSHGAPAGGVPTASVSRALAGWLQGLLWACAAAGLLMAFLAVRAYRVLDDTNAARTSVWRWIEADDAFIGATGLLAIVMVVTAILFIIWTYKAHQASDGLHPGPRSWSSGWAIGAWFIPLANWVLPKLVLTETERIAAAPRSGGTVSPDWRQQPASALGWVWWLTWIAASLFWAIAMFTEETERLLLSEEAIRRSYTFGGLAGLTFAVAGACGALFVLRVSRRLSPQAITTSDHADLHLGGAGAGGSSW